MSIVKSRLNVNLFFNAGAGLGSWTGSAIYIHYNIEMENDQENPSAAGAGTPGGIWAAGAGVREVREYPKK